MARQKVHMGTPGVDPVVDTQGIGRRPAQQWRLAATSAPTGSRACDAVLPLARSSEPLGWRRLDMSGITCHAP
jgi:hypothetical protein